MTSFSKAGKVLWTGFCINLVIGILYAWSVFKKSLVIDSGWSNADATLPYTVAIVVFAAALLIAGILQDRLGPRKVLVLGTALVGVGMILSGLVSTPMALVVTFGVIVGAGIGFGYACLSPAAMKWFHPSKKGFVNGVITAGFGLGAVYIAPVTTWLIEAFGIQNSFIILGSAALVIAVPLACTINNPPRNYRPETPKGHVDTAVTSTESNDIRWKAMLKTPQFYYMWLMFAFASSAGLMVIGNITSIALTQASISESAYLVGIIAIFNCLGRMGGGVLSDKIGGIKTLMIAFLLQGGNMLMFASYSTEFGLIIGSILAGVGYGVLLSVFPSLTAEFYGLKNYGTNYGVLYTAWGVSGFIGPVIAAIAVDMSGSYTLAYTASAVMVGIAFALAIMTRPVTAAQPKKGSDAALA